MTLASSTLSGLLSSPIFQRLVNQVRAYDELENLAIPRAARLAVASALHLSLGVPVLFITDRGNHANTLFDESKHWAEHATRLHYPEPTPLFYEKTPWNDSTRRERLEVIAALGALHLPGGTKKNDLTARDLSRAEHRRQYWEQYDGASVNAEHVPFIITPVRALMTRTLPRRDFLKYTRPLRVGRIAQPDTLIRNWVKLGYEAVDTVVIPGQFARRGGLLDVWAPALPLPVRLDFFGDEIESIRTFDPATQRTTSTINEVLISPAREYICPDTDNTYTEFDLPTLNYPASLLDYLPDDALIIMDDLDALTQISYEIEGQAVELREEMVSDDLLPANFPLPYTPWDELYDAVTLKRYLQFGPSGGFNKSDVARMISPNPRFGGRLKAVTDHILHNTNHGDQVVLVSRQSARLQELWDASTQPRTGTRPPIFHHGTLTDGFTLSLPGEHRVHVLSDGEIFGWQRQQPRKSQPITGTAPEAAFADLQTGDWVVHVDQGIGRFMGLVRRFIDGMNREYLAIEYDNGDQLFVPVHQADRITRYVGPDGRTPEMTTLGSAAWKKTKEKVEKAVEEMAEDLLELYAKRQVVEGHNFSPDSEWMHDLEVSFPYTETEDQLRVIKEVKHDMERAIPMDRLICGDVGYGKTEVALRAAFKAVIDGKQVAVLVPTTVLAQQHYDTFRRRLAAFPVHVEMLSRFRTAKEQREIIERLFLGEVDIVIGTHRLLSGDVEFNDLGLLIIDEEQRFGVTHKETIKKLRTEVDVLTMTATPIPRTLYMALTGVRDISNINTPPEERLPIVTHTGPYSQKQVRQAILRELDRGGQVFFVHNRVQTIYAMRKHLADLVPEARLGVAHGQMPEAKLSRRMREFARGEIDVLLCTTIIESGLDIPNANTLIVDRADTFGLAQLYQLRGRVGRATQQAYAYFFKHRKKPPTEEGRLRLETLAENTQLGAGYSIAMRDLEIRGAGDLLGTRQHGQIAAVGFHLYTRLLSQAVQSQRRAEGTPLKEDLPLAELASVYAPRAEVNVELPIDTSIPESYIADRNIRLRLYRRLANIRNLEAVDKLAAEFDDRFGPLPTEVEHLMYQIRTKILAEKARIISIAADDAQLIVRFDDRPLPYLGSDILTGKTSVRIPLGDDFGWMQKLDHVLEMMQAYALP